MPWCSTVARAALVHIRTAVAPWARRLCAGAATLGLLLAPAPIAADIPAVNYDFVDADGLMEAAGILEEEPRETLRAFLEKMAGEKEAPQPPMPGYTYAGQHGELGEALLSTIRHALRQGAREAVDEFIRTVNEKRLGRGLLRARGGGPYHMEIALTLTDGQPSFVTRHVLENGRSVTFRRSFSLCEPPTGGEFRHTAVGRRLVVTDYFDDRRPRQEHARLCDESTGNWLRDGPWTEWDEQGVKRGEGHFRRDTRDGTWRFWDARGRLHGQAVYREGVVHLETETLWDDRDRPQREETVRHTAAGKVKEVIEWDYHANGKTRSERRFRDGYRDGRWTLWDDQGNVRQQLEFRRGVAMPPRAAASQVDRRVLALFNKAIDLDGFDAAVLAPLADGLDPAGQASLGNLVLGALARSDDNHPEIFERLYLTLIEYAPDTDAAHEAYWRLANLYRQAYEPARWEELIGLMQRFLARYSASDVVSLEKHPDRLLVFSPLHTLHQAYEELGRFQPIVDYYRDRVAKGLPMPAEDCWDYANALDNLGQGEAAVEWYRRYLELHPEPDYSAQLARERIRELRP